jgi:hypothetical protein
MKLLKIGFVLLAFILCSGFLKAQDNISLLAEDGTEWSVGNFSWHPSLPMQMILIKMSGDTVIEEQVYYKLWRSDDIISEQNPGQIHAFVRVSEDSLLIYRTLNGNEQVVFDYKLLLGEFPQLYMSRSVSNGGAPITMEVCGLTEQSYCGEVRKKWSLCGVGDNYGTETWIQGVGPLAGILFANDHFAMVTGFYPKVICAKLNGELIYDNPEYDYCEMFYADYYDRINLLALNNTVWTNAKFSTPYQLTRKDYLWLFGTTQYDIFHYNYYHIVRRSDEYPPTLENSEIAFYVKMFEDSVLYIKNLDNVENPVFDFKMNPGDVASMYGFDYLTGDFYPLEITIEDTGRIETLSGERKYWDVSSDGITRWIEGLGNEEGLMYANYALQGFVGETNFMICAFNEGNQLYINSLFSDCLISEINDYENEETFFLEQSNSLIKIFSRSQKFRCDVFDLAGRKVYSRETENGEIQFLSNVFNSGLYLIYLNDGKTSKLFKTSVVR